ASDFFFSSRRRHTRFSRDWSSDVCSSDLGGHGCISVAANVAPELCAQFQEAMLAGDYARALELNDKLFPLHMALFTDASPGPTKIGRASCRERAAVTDRGAPR